MSWAIDYDPIREFEAQADTENVQSSPFKFDIWENTTGAWMKELKDPSRLRTPPTGLRIVFAPLDLPQRSTKADFRELFEALRIPSAFIRERIQSVSHSFGSLASTDRHCTWFHFLCKHIRVAAIRTPAGFVPAVAHHPTGFQPWAVSQNGAEIALQDPSDARVLPQADYSYSRSSFFLSTSNTGAVTLCCFGASPQVQERLKRFLKSPAWSQALVESYILLDLIMDGLYLEVDENVWSMNKIFGALEHRLLFASTTRLVQAPARELAFAELHNVAKHITHLGEAVESCLLLCESIILRLKTSDSNRLTQQAPPPGQAPAGQANLNRTRQELRDLMLYRQSVFQSTKLRLESLNKRVANSIALSFNLLTSADSTLLIQHSNIMKIMAAITTVFLPTTAVAAIIGSQLFTSSFDGGEWTVRITPLFGIMWAVAIPLTIVVLISVGLWHWSTRHHRTAKTISVFRRRTGF